MARDIGRTQAKYTRPPFLNKTASRRRQGKEIDGGSGGVVGGQPRTRASVGAWFASGVLGTSSVQRSQSMSTTPASAIIFITPTWLPISLPMM